MLRHIQLSLVFQQDRSVVGATPNLKFSIYHASLLYDLPQQQYKRDWALI